MLILAGLFVFLVLTTMAMCWAEQKPAAPNTSDRRKSPNEGRIANDEGKKR